MGRRKHRVPCPPKPRGRPRKTAEEKRARKTETQRHRREGERMAIEQDETLFGFVPKITVYLVRCAVTGMGYVGQTAKPIEKRFEQHCRAARTVQNHPLYEAIREHGAESFTITALAETDALNDANSLEQKYIESERTLSPNGYNLSNGGGRGWHGRYSSRAFAVLTPESQFI